MLVYLISNLVNGKAYVGQTRIGLAKRWRQHLRDTANGSELPVHRALRKHGIQNFSVTVLHVCTSEEELNSKEILAIEERRTRFSEFGYNVTAGGLGGHRDALGPMTGKKHSTATLEKMRAAHAGKPHPQKYRDQNGVNNAMFGKKPWNSGVPITEERRKNIVKGRRGIKPERTAALLAAREADRPRLAAYNDAKTIRIEGHTLKEWSAELGIPPVTLWWRYKRGWPAKAILQRK